MRQKVDMFSIGRNFALLFEVLNNRVCQERVSLSNKFNAAIKTHLIR